ncbi:MAG: rRNA pseudouridine synthase [Deltaproteobacteria bacterium]|nr:rRNA pseudouridine synthase [Deltaproteobacteria bacterium]
MIRLHKHLAQSTPLSLRAAERAIAAGEVTVDGARVTAMGVTVDPARQTICYRGIPTTRAKGHCYLAFYKPKQTIVSKRDPQGRKTVWSCLPPRWQRVNAVGRLDYDSEGLLLLTNDGVLHQRLSHPRFGVAKVYLVKVHGHPTQRVLQQFVAGCVDAGETLKAVSVERGATTERHAWIRIVLHSGRYRHIRRMCEQLGHPVLKLKRIAYGPITLGRLRAGQSRKLTPYEVRTLLALSQFLLPSDGECGYRSTTDAG